MEEAVHPRRRRAFVHAADIRRSTRDASVSEKDGEPRVITRMHVEMAVREALEFAGVKIREDSIPPGVY